jgi:hypothetical protein
MRLALANSSAVCGLSQVAMRTGRAGLGPPGLAGKERTLVVMARYRASEVMTSRWSSIPCPRVLRMERVLA